MVYTFPSGIYTLYRSVSAQDVSTLETSRWKTMSSGHPWKHRAYGKCNAAFPGGQTCTWLSRPTWHRFRFGHNVDYYIWVWSRNDSQCPGATNNTVIICRLATSKP